MSGLDSARWDALMARLGLPPSRDVFERLQGLHAEPHRHYHTADHVNALLRHLDAHRELARRADLIEIAIWFHDAVYRPGSKTNERDSADMAVAVLAPHLDTDDVAFVERTIVLTADHGDTDDPDTQLMLDLDLSILAASPETYADYASRIRREFRRVPGFLFRRGRRKVLRHFLAMPRIYKRDAIAALWEDRARTNLQTELASL